MFKKKKGEKKGLQGREVDLGKMKVSRETAPNIRDEEEERSNKKGVLNSCLGELERDVRHAQNTLILP